MQPVADLAVDLETSAGALTGRTVGIATGLLMAECGCGPDEAFAALGRVARPRDEPVRDLAARVVAARTARGVVL